MEVTGRNSDLRPDTSKGGDEETILFRPRSKGRPAGEPDNSAQPSPGHAKRPVVGWLVVVGGPGAGNSHILGHGVNQIGRDAAQQVSLDYGDQGISRQGHAAITYDPKGRKFYIQQGSGSALAYLNDQPVLQPSPLEAGSRINLGDTTLSFVPFCGPEFDWADVL
ncbi:MAG TPA: FHA domain-containing protein [Luteolibacter sp.]|nr:FHA domain-containing protein [Luteolibacter sp.]